MTPVCQWNFIQRNDLSYVLTTGFIGSIIIKIKLYNLITALTGLINFYFRKERERLVESSSEKVMGRP